MKIMGILNITPNSFFDGNKHFNKNQDYIINYVNQMISDGMDILDIGAESTNPQAIKISYQEEIDRLLPVLDTVIENFNIPISVDTYKPETVSQIIKHYPQIYMINNVNIIDEETENEILNTIRSTNIHYCFCRPAYLSVNTHPNNITEILKIMKNRIQEIIYTYKISQDRLFIDPNLGFNIGFEDNLNILRNIDEFHIFNLPLLIGASRKSFIGKVLNYDNPNDRLSGTLAITAFCYLHNCDVIRVHDIKQNKDVINMLKSINDA